MVGDTCYRQLFSRPQTLFVGMPTVYNLHTPLRTQFIIYHHFTSSPAAAFLALLPAKHFSGPFPTKPGWYHAPLIPTNFPSILQENPSRDSLSSRFATHLSPATQMCSSHAPCTRMFLDHMEPPLHSIRSQITLQDISQAPHNLPTESCLTSVSSQGIRFGRTNQA